MCALYTKAGGYARGRAVGLSYSLSSATASSVGTVRIVTSLPRPGRISAVISLARSSDTPVRKHDAMYSRLLATAAQEVTDSETPDTRASAIRQTDGP